MDKGARMGTGALLCPLFSLLPAQGFSWQERQWQKLAKGWEAAILVAFRELASAEGFCLQPAVWSQRRAIGLPQLDFLTDGQFNEPMYRGSFNMAIIPINLFAAGLE